MGIILAAAVSNGRLAHMGGLVGGVIGIIICAAIRAGRS
jgi:hypothetical protein